MRISDWSSDVCSSDLVEEERYELSANRYEIGASSAYKFDPRNYVVGSARYENDDFSPYDYQAIASAGYGHKFIENERTRLSTEVGPGFRRARDAETRSEEHTSELQSLMRNSYAVLCLKKKKKN